MFTWENKNYPFDILDADTMQVFNKAEKEFWGALKDYESKNAKDGKIDAEGVRAECRMIDTFFENVFGSGKAKEMFRSRFSLSERTKAVKKLYNLKKSQMEEHNSRVAELGLLISSGGED